MEKGGVAGKNFYGNSEEVLQELQKANNRCHYLVSYPDLLKLRQVYAYYIKTAIQDKNEIVIILPFYENADAVRYVLAQKNGPDVDVEKHEKEQSLIIADSLKAYFGSMEGLKPIVLKALAYAKTAGKNCVSIFADVASFFYYHKTDALIDYETSALLHQQQQELEDNDNISLRGFCLYHKQDFDSRLSAQQKQRLFGHHDKNLVIIPSVKSHHFSI